MYKLIKRENHARRGELQTVHGTVQTPAFMNVATAAAIKGAVSAYDLKNIKCQVMLSNTYHLHLRPGDDVVRKMGGVRKFTGWDGPVLTDSGGFQVFSLAKLRNIKEEGVTFASHIDGHRIFMGPEESMRIQSNLGSTIAMAFDECVENPAEYDYAKKFLRTHSTLAAPLQGGDEQTECAAGYDQPEPNAVRHQPGLHIHRPAREPHEGDCGIGARWLCYWRPCGRRAGRGHV